MANTGELKIKVTADLTELTEALDLAMKAKPPNLCRIWFSLMLVLSLALAVATAIHGETLLILLALYGIATWSVALVSVTMCGRRL